MITATLASSEGWKFMMPSDNQRRAPFTTVPTCGISTAISSKMEAIKSQGAQCSQTFIGIWKASTAATKPRPTLIRWRWKK